MKETELAEKFTNYLSDMFDLYYEVGLIDIVGKNSNVIIAVEVKKALNFKVIQQAYDNIVCSHYSYVAVPRSSVKNNPFALQICEKLGLGVLEYNDIDPYILNNVREIVKPKLNRKANVTNIRNMTKNNLYKRTTAGAKSGDTITAFSATVENLEEFVRKHQGCTIKDAITNIEHHYGSLSSAKSCIVRYIDANIIKSIQRDRDKLYTNRVVK